MRLSRPAVVLVAAATALAASAAPQHASVSTLRLSTKLASRGRLGGVSVDGAGNVFVSNFGAHVWRIDPDGTVTVVADTVRGSSGNTVDRQGRLLQASFVDGRILAFGADGVSVIASEGLDGPVGLTTDGANRVYVCNCRGNSIARVDRDGRVTTLASGEPFDCPNGIARGPDEASYVVNFNNSHLVRVSDHGDVSIVATLPAGGNAHVVFAQGAFFVTRIASNDLYRVSLDGGMARYAGTGTPGVEDGPLATATLARPNGIAVSPDGRYLFVNNLVGPWRGDEPTSILLRKIGPIPPAQDLSGVERIEIRVGDLVFDALAAGPADGELVLLLHGFPETSYAFRHQLPALARAGYRAVAPDQRGYSPRARPPGVEPYGMGHLVADVIGIADALGADRFHLVGHDWGGAVAWVVATRHPGRLRTLTALSTPHFAALSAGRSQPGSDQASRSSYFSDLAAPGAEAKLLADDAAPLRAVYGDLDGQAVEVYLRVLGRPEPLRAALAWYAAAFGPRPRAAAPASAAAPPPPPPPITVPTLYVWSTEDSAFGLDAARATAGHVAGPYRFEVVEGVGHWLPELAPDRVNRLLVAHLGGGDAGVLDNYRAARRVLDRATGAVGRTAVQAFTGLAASFAGVSFARGQSRRPGPPFEAVAVSGAFAYEAGGRVWTDVNQRNPGGTDRSYREVLGETEGWHLWTTRDLLTRLDSGEIARLRGIATSYVPAAMPHSLLRAARANAASLRWLGAAREHGRAVERVAFTDSAMGPLVLVVDAESGLPLAVERLSADARLGDVVSSVTFESYREIDGLQVPHRIGFTIGDEAAARWELDAVRVNPPLDDAIFAPPASVAFADYPPSFRPRTIAPGVHVVRLYSGPANTYNSLLVELDDELVVVEPILVDVFAGVVARIASQVAPGKKVTSVVATHHHSDHLGGARGYLARGARLLTTPDGAAVIRTMSGVTATLGVNPVAGRDVSGQLVEVREPTVIGAGERRVEIYPVAPTDHAGQMLLVYIPHARAVYVADLFAIPESGVFPPTELSRIFSETLDRLGLAVETIVPAHGVVGSIEALRRAVRPGA